MREKMADLEDAAFLDESRRDRVYKTSIAILEKGNRKEAEAAKESLERLAEQGYGDSGEKAREAGMKIANLSKRRKKIAVAGLGKDYAGDVLVGVAMQCIRADVPVGTIQMETPTLLGHSR